MGTDDRGREEFVTLAVGLPDIAAYLKRSRQSVWRYRKQRPDLFYRVGGQWALIMKINNNQ